MRDPEVLAKGINDFCNTFDRSADYELIKHLLNEHRTIQQTTMQLVIRYILAVAENAKSGNYDARNQAACAVAEKIKDFLVDEQLAFPRHDDESKLDVFFPCI